MVGNRSIAALIAILNGWVFPFITSILSADYNPIAGKALVPHVVVVDFGNTLGQGIAVGTGHGGRILHRQTKVPYWIEC